MKPPPPPTDSLPILDLGPEQPSDVRKLTVNEAKLLMRKQEENRRQQEELRDEEIAAVAAAKRVKNFAWASIGIVVSTIAITTSTLVFAQNAIDGGAAKAVDPVIKRVVVLETKVERLDVASQESALRTARIETMVEMQLRDRRIQPPPPVSSILDSGR